MERSEAKNLEVKRLEVERLKVEIPKIEEVELETKRLKTEIPVIIEEKVGSGLDQKAEKEEKVLLIACWQVLSLFFKHFRYCFSFLNCLVLPFSSFSSF